MDGRCAGAIVYKYFVRDGRKNAMGYYNNTENVFVSIDYKDRFPFETIVKDELVVIVDFSLQKPGDFERLLGITKNVIWIDHHKSTIEKHEDLNIAGIRRNGTAGCELTWMFFYPGARVPPTVKLIGDYDVWAFKYGDDTKYFQEGIKLEENNPESDNWDLWLSNWDHPGESIANIVKNGKVAIKYRDNYYKDLIDDISFFTEFEGYKVVACNVCRAGSPLFNSIADMKFDLMMPFYYDGRQWVVSIRATDENIDCAKLAEKYGGGGHKGAAGFQCAELPFKRCDEL